MVSLTAAWSLAGAMGADLETVPGAGHQLPWEYPGLIVDIASDFALQSEKWSPARLIPNIL